MSQVVLERVTKVFRGPKGEPIRALENLCLTVEDRELLVLLGPSGCGKTTALRLIAGLEALDGGTIRLDGKDVNGVPPKDRDVAMVFQNPALYPHLTAGRNLAFGLEVRRCPAAERTRRVLEMAELLGITDCLERLPMELSGGQRQRVAVGRALVRRPKLFLLDEPLSNLDLPSRTRMRLELTRLQARLGVTMLYVTHDQVEAMTMGQRVAVMRAGTIEQLGDPLTLYQRPENRFVAGFIGSPAMNFFDGTLGPEGGRLCFHSARNVGAAPLTLPLEGAQAAHLQARIGQKLVLGLRPEHITATAQPAPPPALSLAAGVQLVEPLGAETYLHLASDDHGFVARSAVSDRIGVGERVFARFDMTRAHFFEGGPAGASLFKKPLKNVNER